MPNTELDLKKVDYTWEQVKAAYEHMIPKALDNGNWGVWDIASMDWLDTGMAADANPIVSIEKSATVGLVDTYTISFKNGDTWSFDVTNGKDGPQGPKGDPGTVEIADVTIIEPDELPYVTNTGTNSDPVFHLFLPLSLIRKITITLSTAWTGDGPYTQPVTLYDVTANSKVDLQPDAAIIAQMAADGVTALYIENDKGAFTAYAVGAAPTAVLTVQATIQSIMVEDLDPNDDLPPMIDV